MKQHILEEDIYNLSNDQFVNLLKLLRIPLKDKHHIFTKEEMLQNYIDSKNMHLPIWLWRTLKNRLTIGKMVEILLQHGIPIIFEPKDLEQEDVICDALWEAVKKIL